MPRIAVKSRMSAPERRAQLLGLAAEEFAEGGLHGASVEQLARRAGITQAYVFRIFGTKKALFLEVVDAAFDRLIDGMSGASAPGPTTTGAGDRVDGRAALIAMGSYYDSALADRTGLLVQLQAFAACSDHEVRDRVRRHMSRMWDVVSNRSGLPPVAVKSFLAFGMLLNAAAAMSLADVTEPWALGVRTRINAGLFDHITEATNR